MADSISKSDLFDSILFTEDTIYTDGFKAGFSEGSERGRTEGYQTGYKKGMQIGEEVGFYLGFSETWLEIFKGTTETNERLKRLLSSFTEALLSFEILDVHQDGYFSQIQQLRSKYKQITSLLKVSTEYQESAALNF